MVAVLVVATALGGVFDGALQYQSPQYELQPRAHIGWGSGQTRRDGVESRMWFEAQLPITVALLGCVWGVHPEFGQYSLQWIPTFEVRLRLLNEDSEPVIPPSYLPSPLRLQFMYRKMTSPDPTQNSSGEGRTDYVLGVTLNGWSHHSNGQQDCFFEGDTRGPDGECGGGSKIDINEARGSFSTNDFNGHVFGRYGWDVDDFGVPGGYVLASFGYERHFDLFFPGGLGPDLRPLWGRNKLQASVEVRGSLGPASDKDRANGYLHADVSYTLDDVPDFEDGGPVTPHQVRVEAAAFWPSLTDVGLYVRWQGGQEPMNILFRQAPSRVYVGVVVDTAAMYAEWPGSPYQSSGSSAAQWRAESERAYCEAFAKLRATENSSIERTNAHRTGEWGCN